MLAILVFAGVLFSSCKKGNTGNRDFISLKAEVNSFSIYSDGFDELRVTVKDENNNDVTSQATIYIDDAAVAGNIFTTNTAKTFQVKASAGNKMSNILNVVASPHTANKFTKKIILEEFAGAWCGYCPRLTWTVDSFHTSNNNIIPVQVHNGDLFSYVYELQMRNQLGIFSFPAVFFNRSYLWDESFAMISTELNKRTKCGLAISSNIAAGNNLNISVKTGFDVTTSVPLKLVVLLLEDSLVTAQTNFYNNNPASPFYNLGNPIMNYRHHNVLRIAATDIFGDPISSEHPLKNNIYERSFIINTAGYNINNCKIAAFVLFKENTVAKFGILNAQLVKAGQHIDFD